MSPFKIHPVHQEGIKKRLKAAGFKNGLHNRQVQGRGQGNSLPHGPEPRDLNLEPDVHRILVIRKTPLTTIFTLFTEGVSEFVIHVLS